MSAPAKLLLVLDDDRERLRAFEAVVSRLGEGWVLRTWRTAPGMRAEIDRHLAAAQLISLDHDLYKDSAEDADPGTGRAIADYLATQRAVCPVIVHSTNTDAAWGMHNQLSSAKWSVHLIHHLNQAAWVEDLWLPLARKLVG